MTHREWPFIEAQRIIDRLSAIGPDAAGSRQKKSVTAETGYGPSGLPHIGTFGEVARTSFVLQALKTLAPRIDSRIIAFSDDMDGLREVPRNLPNAEMLKEHLGKPLTSIPDPFGEEKSFAHYMNHRLRDFLDSFGFTYTFASSTEQYASGVFDEGLRRVMAHYDEISELFKATIAEEKRAAWSPFFPVCESCGRIYSTRVTEVDTKNATVSYACDSPLSGKYAACGHVGATSILGGRCKCGWKVDWALRWYSLGIDYEMHGEDLLDSARLSSRIVKILGGEPPELFKYELFLDEKGKKISKKLGNGISIEQWLRFAPVDSLLYIMYTKPQQAKKMGLPILPEIVDAYLELVAGYDGSEDSPVPFISRLSKGAHADRLSSQRVITYSLVLELILALNQDDPRIVRDYLLKFQPDIAGNVAYYESLIEDALAYYREVLLPGRTVETADHQLDTAIAALRDELARREAAAIAPDADELQTATFQVAKDRDVKMKEWFRTLYRVFLGQSQGPRIGSFIALLGYRTCIERLEAHLSKTG
ncbi:MAG TPA: lysine--tRNA ligase [Spirochaetia bacterium]|nr:lysine--tRNA ligase [Spirochaetia bacterium]